MNLYWCREINLHIVAIESKKESNNSNNYNNLQSIFLINISGGRTDNFCKSKSRAKNVELIQLQNLTYIMDSASIENYAWIIAHEDDWNQQTWFLVDYDI